MVGMAAPTSGVAKKMCSESSIPKLDTQLRLSVVVSSWPHLNPLNYSFFIC